MTTARTGSSLEVWQSSLPGLPETIEVSQTVAQSFEDIGIDVKLVEVEFARAIDAMRDRHDAHFVLPVRQTIRPINANTRIYYYAGGGRVSETSGLPTGWRYRIWKASLYDDTYDKPPGGDRPRRVRQSSWPGSWAMTSTDTYRSIPIVNVRCHPGGINPEEVSGVQVFGSITGVFGHLEYAKARQVDRTATSADHVFGTECVIPSRFRCAIIHKL